MVRSRRGRNGNGTDSWSSQHQLSPVCGSQPSLWHRDLGAALGEDGVISWEGLSIKRGG